MNENRLILNENKTEVFLSGSAGSLRKLERSSIHIDLGDSEILLSGKVNNLSIHFDRDFSLRSASHVSHVNIFIRTTYPELRKIENRHLINSDCAALLVSGLVLSTWDYCNSLLAGPFGERLKTPNSSE